MFKQIVKIIWKQRRSNGWIFMELLMVAAVLWYVADMLWIDTRVYNQPMGYDIENCWRLKLYDLNSNAPGFVSEEERTTSETEDLIALMENIRRETEVENVCASFYSHPYSWGNSWSSLEPVEGDTATARTRSYQTRRVTPEFFDVFRVKDKRGNAITPQLPPGEPCYVISEDMEEHFFEGKEGKGQRVRNSQHSNSVLVAAVSTPIRASDYEISDPCFFDVMVGSRLELMVKGFNASSAEVCLRMKRSMTLEEMYLFLESMGERLTVNNIYVYGAYSIAQQRKEVIRSYQNESRTKIALMGFMLVNVFFGIIGTFWLRTQHRRGEIGLRIAMGSTTSGISRFMNLESLSLLLLTLPFILLFVGNMAFLDIIESGRISIGWERILPVVFATYLLLGIIIWLGIRIPARKAASLPPAEALRHE
ncbi:multidrug ABC transporter substrate-binding protein [Parabacteroides sp. OttesenSCG-928-O15]|nr:multidrug ABC transporter substrate-binding protein [Parabacteroides sp. OttesenSCG-928-O15]